MIIIKIDAKKKKSIKPFGGEMSLKNLICLKFELFQCVNCIQESSTIEMKQPTPNQTRTGHKKETKFVTGSIQCNYLSSLFSFTFLSSIWFVNSSSQPNIFFIWINWKWNLNVWLGCFDRKERQKNNVKISINNSKKNWIIFINFLLESVSMAGWLANLRSEWKNNDKLFFVARDRF